MELEKIKFEDIGIIEFDGAKIRRDAYVDINKTIETWRDAYVANEYMKSICNSAVEEGIVSEDDYSGRTKYWESYLGDLQKKYSDSIWINYDEFNKISLININFVAMRPGVPYPVPIPGFPTLIPSGNLDSMILIEYSGMASSFLRFSPFAV